LYSTCKALWKDAAASLASFLLLLFLKKDCVVLFFFQGLCLIGLVLEVEAVLVARNGTVQLLYICAGVVELGVMRFRNHMHGSTLDLFGDLPLCCSESEARKG
jgi:hypothetical protein